MGEPLHPAGAFGHVAGGPIGAVFREEGCLPGLWFVPVVPAFLADMAADPAVQKDDPGIFSPGTAQIGGVGRAVPGEAAVFHDVTVGLPLRGGGGSDISIVRFRSSAVLSLRR